jgi:peroxiredoxin
MREAPGAHDPTKLPPDLPVPVDDGAARHLTGASLPDITLLATAGPAVTLSKLKGASVLYVYPRTGVPGVDAPPGWDDIPGARGCTPQSCGFRDHAAELEMLGARVAGLSAQSLEEQEEAAARLHIPYPVIADPELLLARELDLPTFSFEGVELYKRVTLILARGRIEHVFYPVFPPDRNAAMVVAWLRARS